MNSSTSQGIIVTMNSGSAEQLTIVSRSLTRSIEGDFWMVYLTPANKISFNEKSKTRESRKSRIHLETIGKYIIDRCVDSMRPDVEILSTGTQDSLATAELTATVLEESFKINPTLVDLSYDQRVVSDRHLEYDTIQMALASASRQESATILVAGKSAVSSFINEHAYLENYAQAIVIERDRITPVTNGYIY